MARTQPRAGAKILAVITRGTGGVSVTLRSVQTRRRIAVIEGSEAFCAKALKAVGLFVPAPTVATFAKHRDGARVPLVRRKPANGDL